MTALRKKGGGVRGIASSLLCGPTCSVGSHTTWNESRRKIVGVFGRSVHRFQARVGTLHSVAQRELWAHCRIRVHGSKTHVWNRAGQKPEACNRLQRVAEVHDPTARVWRGSEVPLAEQGVKVLGTPVGHDEYVRSLLEKIQAKQQFLLNAIPTVPDVQSAWLLLLHCASARANYQLRVVRPELVNSFAESHDQGLWRCLCAIVGVPAETCDGLTRATATLPLSLGGLGLRSAARTRESAY